MRANQAIKTRCAQCAAHHSDACPWAVMLITFLHGSTTGPEGRDISGTHACTYQYQQAQVQLSSAQALVNPYFPCPAAGNPVDLYLRRGVPPGQLYGEYETAAINPASWTATATVAVILLPGASSQGLQPGEWESLLGDACKQGVPLGGNLHTHTAWRVCHVATHEHGRRTGLVTVSRACLEGHRIHHRGLGDGLWNNSSQKLVDKGVFICTRDCSFYQLLVPRLKQSWICLCSTPFSTPRSTPCVPLSRWAKAIVFT